MCTLSCLRVKGSTVRARRSFLGSIRAFGSSQVHVWPSPIGKLRILHLEASTLPLDISDYDASVASKARPVASEIQRILSLRFWVFCIFVPVAALGDVREVYVASVWFNSFELSRDARCS